MIPRILPEAPDDAGERADAGLSRLDLADLGKVYAAQNDRIRALSEFLRTPVCAPGGDEPDPEVVAAYNLAIATALHGIRAIVLDVPIRAIPGDSNH
jgi:hypothetical protein